MSHTDLDPDEILPELHGPAKAYTPSTALAGVELLRLQRHVDDRGSFLEVYRAAATHRGSEALADFFAGIEVAQVNWSVVEQLSTVKGLHYHLHQTDVWFCPPGSKMKIVLWDLRRGSPTSGCTQVVVSGGGRDLLVKIPPGIAHGYRPLAVPCALLYLVTRPFSMDEPDEHRVAWDHPQVRHLWEVENA